MLILVMFFTVEFRNEVQRMVELNLEVIPVTPLKSAAALRCKN